MSGRINGQGCPADEAAARAIPATTFAARAILNQGDIINVEPQFRVSGSHRRFTELHEAVLLGKYDEVERLCREQPQLCKVKDEGGNMPIHVAAQMDTMPSRVVGMLIDGFPEALVLRNNDGFVPGTLAQQNPKCERDVKNMLQDGRTTEKGNWVYDRYEKERLAATVRRYEARKDRESNARAVRPAIAGYVQPRNKKVFLSAHESAR